MMDRIKNITYNILDTVWEIILNLLVFFGFKSVRSDADHTARLDGQTVIITGGNKGIGREVSMDAAKRGARVIIAARDTTAGEDVAVDIRDKVPGSSVSVMKLDLGSLSSIKSFVADVLQEPRIDILINNAGMMLGSKRTAPESGWELMIAVNYLGLVYLTMSLLPKLKSSSDPKVINLASIAHSSTDRILWEDLKFEKTKWNWKTAYGQTKLAVVLFTRELAKRNPWLRAYSVDPGISLTGLFETLDPLDVAIARSTLVRPLFRSVKSAANNVVHAMVHDKNKYDPDNNYLYDGRVKIPSPSARSQSAQKDVWEKTARVLDLESIMN